MLITLHFMSVSKKLISSLKKLKKTNEIIQRFYENAMKANTDKSHLLITTNEEKYFFIWGEIIQNGKVKMVKENLLKLNIDNKLSFTEHVN